MVTGPACIECGSDITDQRSSRGRCWPCYMRYYASDDFVRVGGGPRHEVSKSLICFDRSHPHSGVGGRQCDVCRRLHINAPGLKAKLKATGKL